MLDGQISICLFFIPSGNYFLKIYGLNTHSLWLCNLPVIMSDADIAIGAYAEPLVSVLMINELISKKVNSYHKIARLLSVNSYCVSLHPVFFPIILLTE